MTVEHQMVERPFHLITKPIGAICNLNCTYCFYLSKEHLYPNTEDFRMSDEVLEAYVKGYMQQPADEITFTWQGGEPTLMGIDYYRKALEYQQKHKPEGKTIHNSIQTNGVKIDREWAEFLSKHEFLVGVSLDGPDHLHNTYRRTKGDRDTHQRVMQGIKHLKKAGVDYNILCCVNRVNARHPLEVYEFLHEQSGTPYWQFIPIVENNPHESEGVSPYSVTAEQYGNFLTQMFDRWVRRDLGRVSIQMFDVTLRRYLGMRAGLCLFEETCGDALAIEHNGDVYSCDHYVDPDHHLGNVMEQPLQEMVNAPFQREFGRYKRDGLPDYCKQCEVYELCRGGCPKNRFIKTPGGEEGFNYLCEGFKHYFTYTAPYFRFIADQYRRHTPLPAMMEYIRSNPDQFIDEWPARNDPCYCGSGMKFKKCCLS